MPNIYKGRQEEVREARGGFSTYRQYIIKNNNIIMMFLDDDAGKDNFGHCIFLATEKYIA